MSRLELLDHVLVLNTCPNAFYRGYRGVIIDDSRWGTKRVELVIDGITYKPLIAPGHLEKIVPESEASA